MKHENQNEDDDDYEDDYEDDFEDDDDVVYINDENDVNDRKVLSFFSFFALILSVSSLTMVVIYGIITGIFAANKDQSHIWPMIFAFCLLAFGIFCSGASIGLALYSLGQLKKIDNKRRSKPNSHIWLKSGLILLFCQIGLVFYLIFTLYR